MAAYPTEGSALLRCSPWLGSSLRVSYCLRYTMCLPERELKEHIKAPALRKQVLLLLEREGNDKKKKFYFIICSFLCQELTFNNLKSPYSK